MNAPVAVILAHPDDETLACGALLPRLRDLTLVHVTDGAPRDGADAGRHGFASRKAYAAARRKEVEAALSAGGVCGARVVTLDIPDQEATQAMADVARRLVGLLGASEIVLTHAFEGGHPDHDAVAVAVHAAAALLADQGRAPAIVEMSLYRAGPGDGWLRQSFREPDGPSPPTTLRLTGLEADAKAGMIAAHASQRETLAAFALDVETYRVAPCHDFTSAPNGGAVLYERYAWGMTQPRFAELVRGALHELGLDDGRLTGGTG